MPNTNNFLPVAIGGVPNVVDQVTYAAALETEQGFADGEAPDANLWNKMMRQATFVASQVAQAMSDILAVDVLDNGIAATFLANFKAMIFYRAPVGFGTGRGAFAAAGMPADTVVDVPGAPARLYTIMCSMTAQYDNSNGVPIAPIISFVIKDGATVVATLSSNYQNSTIPIAYNNFLQFSGIVNNLAPPVAGHFTISVVDAEADGGSHSYANTSASFMCTTIL